MSDPVQLNHTAAEVNDAVGVAKGAGTGLVAKTGTGAGARRTLTPGSEHLVVTNGNGASGNPTIDLSTDVKAALAAVAGKVPATREITAGTGLEGGGDLSANRELALTAAVISLLGLAETSLQPDDVEDFVEGDGITHIVALDETAYAALDPPVATTLYVVLPDA